MCPRLKNSALGKRKKEKAINCFYIGVGAIIIYVKKTNINIYTANVICLEEKPRLLELPRRHSSPEVVKLVAFMHFNMFNFVYFGEFCTVLSKVVQLRNVNIDEP